MKKVLTLLTVATLLGMMTGCQTSPEVAELKKFQTERAKVEREMLDAGRVYLPMHPRMIYLRRERDAYTRRIDEVFNRKWDTKPTK